MRSQARNRVYSLLPAMTAPLWMTALVWAQNAPPSPALDRGPAAWMGYAVMLVLVALVLAISLMPSKRSHQD